MTRTFFFAVKMSRASSLYPGAMTASRKVEVSSLAVAASTVRLKPTMPPKAETGSHSRALR